MRRCLPFGFLLLLVIWLLPVSVVAEPLRQVRITAADPAELAATFERAGFDVLEGSVTLTSLDLVVSVEELQVLRDAGHAVEQIAVGRPYREIQRENQEAAAAGDRAVPPGYLNLIEIIEEMAIAAATYPSICQLVNLTATYGAPLTYENRQMWAVKISDNVTQQEDEPAYLMVGAHHCREIVTPVLSLYALERFTAQYGIDPLITALVDQNEIWIAPVWNPDGYEYVFNVENMWRKNRRVFPGGTGVDLNRNYPQGWYNPCSGSSDPGSNTYKGPEPASEAETQTMILWSEAERFAKVMDYHSSGREVLHGYACWDYPFDAFLEQEASDISVAASYGGDVRSPSADGEHYEWQLGMRGALAFLAETHSQFQPSYSSAQNEAVMVWPSTIWQLARPIPLWGHVTDAGTGAPLTATISYVGVLFENDETNSSGGAYGRYHAFMPGGTYDVVFEADGYQTQTITGVVIDAFSSLQLDVQLVPESTAVAAADGVEAGGEMLLLAVNPLSRVLRYQINRPTHTRLKIFDVRGALVRLLVEEDHAPGQYEAVWHGRNDQGRRVASGSYYYRLETDTVTENGKMLLIR